MTRQIRRILIPRADRFLLAITVIWGSTFTVTKFALQEISPMLLQGTRFSLAALLVGMYTWKDIKATNRESLRAGLILGVYLGLAFALQTVGLLYTSASKAGFLTGTMVVFTPILQLIIERRLPSVGNIIGVIIVGAGLFIFTSPAGGSFNQGDLLVLLCAVVYAFYIVYLDVYTKDGFRREIVFYQFIVTAAIAFVAAPFMDHGISSFTPTVLGSILYLAFFASAVAIFVQSKYQRETTPTKAAIIFTAEPVFAAIIAYLVLDEIMTGTAIFGAGIIFAGMLFSEIYSALTPRD